MPFTRAQSSSRDSNLKLNLNAIKSTFTSKKYERNSAGSLESFGNHFGSTTRDSIDETATGISTMKGNGSYLFSSTVKGVGSYIFSETGKFSPQGAGSLLFSRASNNQEWEENDEKRKPCLSFMFNLQYGMIHPDSMELARWGFFRSVLKICVLAVYPFFAAFLEKLHVGPVLVFADLFISIVFCFDIYIKHNTAIQDRYGLVVVFDKTKTKQRYLFSSQFFMDVIACMPVLLLNFHTRHEILRGLFIAKFLKCLRGIANDKTLSSEFFNYNIGQRRLITLVLLLPLVSNALACGWLFFLDEDPFDWGNSYFLGLPEEVFDYYTSSVYWAVSTLTSVGFGDILAASTGEYIYATLSCYGSAITGGLVIAYVSSISTERNDVSQIHSQRLRSVESYLKFRKVPKDLSIRIKRYLKTFYMKKTHFDEKIILDGLTSDLRRQLGLHILQRALNGLSIFRGISDPNLISRLVESLKPSAANPGDDIVKAGDVATEMFFLVSGHVDVISDQGEYQFVITRLGPGNHFGELSLIHAGNELYSVTVRAVEKCDLMSLNRSQLLSLGKQYPFIQERLQNERQRTRSIINNLRLQVKCQKMVMDAEQINDMAEMLDAHDQVYTSPLISRRGSLTEETALQMLSINTNYVKHNWKHYSSHLETMKTESSIGSNSGKSSSRSNEDSSSSIFITKQDYARSATMVQLLTKAAEQQRELIDQLRKAVEVMPVRGSR